MALLRCLLLVESLKIGKCAFAEPTFVTSSVCCAWVFLPIVPATSHARTHAPLFRKVSELDTHTHSTPAHMMRSAALLATAPALLLLLQGAVAWSPLPSRLPTRWDQDVNETSPLPEYPRPTLVRTDPLSRHMLNGVWQLDRTVADLSDPPINRGISGGEDILVPFPIESSLGGVGNVTEHGYSMYYLLADQRVLPPRAPSRTRMLLHFEAVDWETHVWVNGFKQTPLSPQGNHTNSCPGGQCHRGGYDAFYFDITDSVTGPCESESGVACPPGHIEIIVGVFDPTDCDGSQPGQCVQVNGSHAASKTGMSGPSPLVNPVGKQSRQANLEPVCCHTRYSSTSGIWGSVWLEGVPSAYVADVVVCSFQSCFSLTSSSSAARFARRKSRIQKANNTLACPLVIFICSCACM